MKKFVSLVFALLISSIAIAHTDGIYNRAANSVGDTQGIDSNGAAGVAPSVPAFAYLGNFSSLNLPNATTMLMPFTMTNTAGLLVVYFGIQNTQSVTSVVYDAAGANITLTQDAFVASGVTGAVYSGVIPAASGSKTVTVNCAGSLQFLTGAGQAWLATNLISNLKQQSATTTTPVASISADQGYFMFGGAFSAVSSSGVTWGTSTQVPGAIHPDANTLSYGADWTIVSTNAAFSLTPKAANSYAQAYATYH